MEVLIQYSKYRNAKKPFILENSKGESVAAESWLSSNQTGGGETKYIVRE